MAKAKKSIRGENKLMPISAENENVRAWDKIRFAYATYKNVQQAHISRLFLFRTEGQGYKKALSLQHNKARFPNRKVLLPPREREHQEQAKQKEKQKEKKQLIKALHYAEKYGVISPSLIERCESVGIRVRRWNNRLTLSADELFEAVMMD